MRIFLLFTCILYYTAAFSIPGVSITTYEPHRSVKVFANELDSVKTQLPFSYYKLKYCKDDKIQSVDEHETLGGVLLGEKSELTQYQINMLNNKTCEVLCFQDLTKEDVRMFKWMIDREYFVNLMIDNLPGLYDDGTNLHIGFPVGSKDRDNNFIINNHVTFRIGYYKVDENKSRIVSFSAEAKSMDYYSEFGPDENEKSDRDDSGKDHTHADEADKQEAYCQDQLDEGTFSPQVLKEGEMTFSYDVIFEESDRAVGTRFDKYKFIKSEQIHWMSISYSFIINIVLTIIIAHIMRRTLGKDIKQYNELRTSEDIKEDSGWKQLARQVFRPPKYPLSLSVLIGTGFQLGSMMLLTLIFACMGFMEQTDRGVLLTTIILSYNFMGVFAGYYSARVYKMYKGVHWIRCTLATALFYPGVLFICFYMVNIMMIFEESSSAVHLSTILFLMALWFGISLPLVFLGSLIGYKKQIIKNPCPYESVPYITKNQPWYLNSYAIGLFGGLLPFGTVFIELVFIMSSIWRHSFYYLFAFLFVVIILLVITCAEISIVITYLQLCNGNPKFWWRSFTSTASMAIYIFAYSVFYYLTELEMVRFSSIFMYFGYMFIISLTCYILCGSIGFISSYLFVRKIYSLIKID